MANRRDATRLVPEVIGAQVDELLRARPVAVTTPEGEKTRKRTPHQEGLKARRVTIALPSAAWRAAIEAEAERWGVRVCDVLVFAFAQMMSEFEGGGLRRPGRNGTRFYHRAGEGLDLPWGPE